MKGQAAHSDPTSISNLIDLFKIVRGDCHQQKTNNFFFLVYTSSFPHTPSCLSSPLGVSHEHAKRKIPGQINTTENTDRPAEEHRPERNRHPHRSRSLNTPDLPPGHSTTPAPSDGGARVCPPRTGGSAGPEAASNPRRAAARDLLHDGASTAGRRGARPGTRGCPRRALPRPPRAWYAGWGQKGAPRDGGGSSGGRSSSSPASPGPWSSAALLPPPPAPPLPPAPQPALPRPLPPFWIVPAWRGAEHSGSCSLLRGCYGICSSEDRANRSGWGGARGATRGGSYLSERSLSPPLWAVGVGPALGVGGQAAPCRAVPCKHCGGGSAAVRYRRSRFLEVRRCLLHPELLGVQPSGKWV